MDIPKIYLRKLNLGGNYDYDAVDGQQRLRAIWNFRANDLPLEYNESLGQINGIEVNGLRFEALPQVLKNQFDKFDVSVAEISSAPLPTK